jgi:hypothetical protein
MKRWLPLLLLVPLLMGFVVLKHKRQAILREETLYEHKFKNDTKLQVLVNSDGSAKVILAKKDARFEDGQLLYLLQFDSKSGTLDTSQVLDYGMSAESLGSSLNISSITGRFSSVIFAQSDGTNESIYANLSGGFLPETRRSYQRNGTNWVKHKEAIRYHFEQLRNETK